MSSSSREVLESHHRPDRHSAPEADTRIEDARPRRSTGKGRYRRAAAEQRRIEQQRWGQYNDAEEITPVVPNLSSSARRKQLRRAMRRNPGHEEIDDYYAGYSDEPYRQSIAVEDEELGMALALSLSLVENSGSHLSTELSYENLVNLEAVQCVLSKEVVSSLPTIKLDAQMKKSCSDEICAICQSEFVEGDDVMVLPCTHDFHQNCGSEWLLSYSKCCPVCKLNVEDVDAVHMMSDE